VNRARQRRRMERSSSPDLPAGRIPLPSPYRGFRLSLRQSISASVDRVMRGSTGRVVQRAIRLPSRPTLASYRFSRSRRTLRCDHKRQINDTGTMAEISTSPAYTRHSAHFSGGESGKGSLDSSTSKVMRGNQHNLTLDGVSTSTTAPITQCRDDHPDAIAA